MVSQAEDLKSDGDPTSPTFAGCLSQVVFVVAQFDGKTSHIRAQRNVSMMQSELFLCSLQIVTARRCYAHC